MLRGRVLKFEADMKQLVDTSETLGHSNPKQKIQYHLRCPPGPRSYTLPNLAFQTKLVQPAGSKSVFLLFGCEKMSLTSSIIADIPTVE